MKCGSDEILSHDKKGCEKCPNGLLSSLDKKKCVCPKNHLFLKDGTCKKCTDIEHMKPNCTCKCLTKLNDDG